MEISYLKRMRELEDENNKLKRLVADQDLDNLALKAMLGKNSKPGTEKGNRPSWQRVCPRKTIM